MQGSCEADDVEEDVTMGMITENDVMAEATTTMTNPSFYAQDVSRKHLGCYGNLIRATQSY